MDSVLDVTLTEFYRDSLDALRNRGCVLLLLAIARDAEAPDLYQDIYRYWNSLHDLTGPHVVFAVAGRPVSNARDRAVVYGSRGYVSSEWLDTLDAAIGKAEGAPAYFREAQELARNSTLQVDELRRFLGLREADLPCLHITMLGNETTRTRVLPFRARSGLSIYSLCKDVMVTFGELLDVFAAAVAARDRAEAGYESQVSSLQEELRQAQLSKAERRAIENLSKAEALVASLPGEAERDGAEVLEIARAGATAAGRARGKELLSALRNAGLVSAAQGALLRSVLDSQRPPTGRLARIAECEGRLSSITAARNDGLAELDQAVRRARAVIEDAFGDAPETRVPDTKYDWDAFVSHAAHDSSVAEEVFLTIEQKGRAFLDTRTIKPGDNWRRLLPMMQAASRATIPIITANTPAAHYQHSEIEAAIRMFREGGHLLIPLRFKGAPLPFGLEQIQAIDWDGGSAARQKLLQAVFPV